MTLFGGSTLSVFLILVVGLGGLAAYATGRAVAVTWRPLYVLCWFLFLLTLAIRFLSFALFEEPLLSVPLLILDYAVLLGIGLSGWRITRTNQMVTQYSWLYEKTGLFFWRLKPGQDDSF